MSTADLARPGTERITYDDSTVRKFVAASVGWGIVAMLLGALIALQLAFFKANIGPYFTFGRLRPLHTNAAIFAFVGNMIFAGIYHSTQRLVKARLGSDLLSKIHFWGWQAIIVAAAITLPLGMSQAKEYAELEWPIDVAIAIVWIVFAINFFWMLAKRREKQLYVAIWFYIATIVTVAVLHIVNSLAIPVGLFKSYSIYGGAKDALVQWWYGHNAVAFFLTTPVLGIMYYYMPKAAERPVYSYRLSIIHFWALIFVYIWAGPHHLLNTALPEWAQTLGMVFSVMLWAPSWGGMINGLLTLRGAWHKLRTDPVLKFLAAGITFYGMATFEGPMLSIRSVSALAHYTDWIIGHVHIAALGWNGFMAAGMFYWMVPRLYGTKLFSTKLADLHFFIGSIGILLYAIAMYVSGITQGLMLRAEGPGGALVYPNFVETVVALKPLYWMRLVGGLLYLVGFVLMAYNLVKTARAGVAVDGYVDVPVAEPVAAGIHWAKIFFAPPVIVSAVVILVLSGISVGVSGSAGAFMLLAFFIAFGAILARQLTKTHGQDGWHTLLEGRALLLTVLALLAVLVGGVAELVPALLARTSPTELGADLEQHPYRALELEGRDVYLREGCYTCHSQMIRPFGYETARYGEVSKLGDSKYDHPFQWGSKRTGPDLAREGGRYPNLWHWQHMIDPRSITQGSIMPSYAFMATTKVEFDGIPRKLTAMRAIGVPYTPEEIAHAIDDARAQSAEITRDLKENGVLADPDCQLVALIAYVQRIGTTPIPAPSPRISAVVPTSATSAEVR
jgi:cytochrome c oxidase cbb3-type subunit I/II